MCHALNKAKLAKGGFLDTAMEEMQQLIKKSCAKVREEKKRGVEFPGDQKVKAEIERDPAMIYKNHMDGCLPWPNRTAKNPQTSWKRKETGAPLPDPAAPPPGTPPTPPGDTDGTVSDEIEGMPSWCVYIHSRHPNT